jgi:hypothetical protein
VLRLRKALYGLRRSPLLWQTDLTNTLKELGFKEVPQEPCVMLRGSVIVFFYVDDIVFCYPKGVEADAKAAVAGLRQKYTMSVLGELKWFLGIHVLRDRAKRFLWLSQEAYIDRWQGTRHADDRTGARSGCASSFEEEHHSVPEEDWVDPFRSDNHAAGRRIRSIPASQAQSEP